MPRPVIWQRFTSTNSCHEPPLIHRRSAGIHRRSAGIYAKRPKFPRMCRDVQQLCCEARSLPRKIYRRPGVFCALLLASFQTPQKKGGLWPGARRARNGRAAAAAAGGRRRASDARGRGGQADGAPWPTRRRAKVTCEARSESEEILPPPPKRAYFVFCHHQKKVRLEGGVAIFFFLYMCDVPLHHAASPQLRFPWFLWRS